MFVQVQNHQPQGHVSFQSTPIEHPILRARTGNGRRPLPQRASPRGTSQRQCRVKRHLGITLHGTGISYSMCMHDACTIYSICVMCVLCIYKILYIYTPNYIFHCLAKKTLLHLVSTLCHLGFNGGLNGNIYSPGVTWSWVVFPIQRLDVLGTPTSSKFGTPICDWISRPGRTFEHVDPNKHPFSVHDMCHEFD